MAVVTGAAAGIGYACAERLAREGASVTLLDIDAVAGRAAAAAICASGARAQFIACDVGVKASADESIEAAAQSMGRIDILISNAGISRPAGFLEVTESDFDLVIRTNLKGVFLCGQAAARQMLAQGGNGVIINLSSINAVVAMPTGAAYAASKGGVNQLTRVMAVALAPHRIRVNAIGPGTIETELTAKSLLVSEEAKRRVLSRTPLGRLGAPHEVAAIAAFLASDEASYLTGQILYADGGRLALNLSMPIS